MSNLLSRRVFIYRALALALLPNIAVTREIDGVTMDEKAVFENGAQLQLVGAGKFHFFFLSVYMCGLYLPPRDTWGSSPLKNDTSRRITLVMLRESSAGQFLWGLNKGLANNSSASELQSISEQLDTLRGTVRNIRVLGRGRRVDIDYTPETGTRIFVDGRVVGNAIMGKALNDALLRVWIGKRPLDNGLKEALLG